jgi:hypothetical protein
MYVTAMNVSMVAASSWCHRAQAQAAVAAVAVTARARSMLMRSGTRGPAKTAARAQAVPTTAEMQALTVSTMRTLYLLPARIDARRTVARRSGYGRAWTSVTGELDSDQ